MKYYIYKNKYPVLFYTFYILEYLIKINHHQLTDIINCDAILFSICDVTEIFELEQLRKNYPDKIIIVGGHFSCHWKLLLLFADYINIGQAFNFFKCNSFVEIENLKNIIYKNKNSAISDNFIDWLTVPIVRINKQSYYYWAGSGCKNKCKFCLTSWTNKYQQNDKKYIDCIKRKIPKKASIKYISNDYTLKVDGAKIQDILLKDFIKLKNKNVKTYRLGIEFAKEETRKKCGKYFTNDDFFKAIELSQKLGCYLLLFCISGVDSYDDWYNLIKLIPVHYRTGPKIIFKFTNLEYQMFTPIYKDRFDLNIENYLDITHGKKMFYDLCLYERRRVIIMTIKYPAHALWRMGMSASVNIDQFNEWKKLKNCKDIRLIYEKLYSTKVIKNDYSDSIVFNK